MTDNKKALEAIDEAGLFFNDLFDHAYNKTARPKENIKAYDNLDLIIQASKALLEDGGWRDIESAPKDGVEVWGKWENPNGEFQGVIYFNNGFWEDYYMPFEPSLTKITHWKPLDSEERALKILSKIGGV